jgi:hypothetical protein
MKDWQQIGDAARNVVERLERRVIITVHHVSQEPRVIKVPITVVEQEPLVLKIEVERRTAR